MKNKGIMALALVSVLSVSALAPSAFAAAPAADGNTETTVQEMQKEHRHGKHGDKQKAVEPENAIGKDAAKEKALADAGLTAEQAGKVKSRVSQLDDGTVVYKVRFTYDGQKYSYQINAVTGEVVDKSVQAVTEDAAESRGHGRHGMKKGGKPAAEEV